MPRMCFVFLLVAALLVVSQPGSAALKTGDILVADNRVGVLVIDGATHAVTTLSLSRSQGGTQLDAPFGVAIGPAGQIYVLDLGNSSAGPTTAVVWQLDPVSGLATPVSSGGLFKQPRSIAVGPDGTIYVGDIGTNGSDGAVIKIPPGGGAQSILLSGGQPWALAVDNSGYILVSRYPQTKVETFSSGGALMSSVNTSSFSPVSMTVTPQNLIYLFGISDLTSTSSYANSYTLDETSHALSPFYNFGSAEPPFGAAVLPDGDIVASLQGGQFPVVLAFHPDGSIAWRVGDYRMNPFGSPAGVAVCGVRNGVVPAAVTSWGAVKAHYRK